MAGTVGLERAGGITDCLVCGLHTILDEFWQYGDADIMKSAVSRLGRSPAAKTHQGSYATVTTMSVFVCVSVPIPLTDDTLDDEPLTR